MNQSLLPKGLTPQECTACAAVIDRVLLKAGGIVYLSKAKTIDPNTLDGVLTLEYLLTKDTMKATEKIRSKAIKTILDIATSLPDEGSLSAKEIARWESALEGVMLKYGVSMPDLVNQATEKHIRRALQLTRDSAKKSIKAPKDDHPPKAFKVRDQRAVNGVANVNKVFIQKTYKEEQTVKIKAYFQRNLIKLGGSRNAAVKGLKKEFPEYFKNMDAHYLKTVSASHINTARLWSNSQLYKDAGYKEMELIVILDERTTQICTNLSGLTFKIESTIKTLESFYSAKTYQEMADSRPYLRDERVNGELTGAMLYNKGGETFRIDQNTPVEELEKAGIAGPPFHHLCRTTVGVKI